VGVAELADAPDLGSGGATRRSSSLLVHIFISRKLQMNHADIIATHIQSAAGLSKLAAAMIAPLRNRRDYSSIARKAFKIESLCFVCGEETESRIYFNKNFKKVEDLFIPGEFFKLCTKCQKKTRTRLRELKAMPIEQMPLYINDDNIFLQYRAVERLKKG
jgi:hypothetical protein